ncbi:hypothetical protein AVEN_108388-1 [Araneus ventricosus]|uniref:Uncharacterized protein n=1 Tax=Araneus ventricosus TaxID=182803 RepID=A0A4Y2CYN7_ARAVE|nr:hypothetical protein AVEN_108388-1 [Araneus ventricosus]
MRVRSADAVNSLYHTRTSVFDDVSMGLLLRKWRFVLLLLTATIGCNLQAQKSIHKRSYDFQWQFDIFTQIRNFTVFAPSQKESIFELHLSQQLIIQNSQPSTFLVSANPEKLRVTNPLLAAEDHSFFLASPLIILVSPHSKLVSF